MINEKKAPLTGSFLMQQEIQDFDVWLFGQLYSIIANFADKPENVISRIGSGRISIPEDQGEDLYQVRRTILEKYPRLADLAIMRITDEIETILSRHDPVGKATDDWFWTNKGFLRHDDWLHIRERARAFLLR
jgi:hypothetical protein